MINYREAKKNEIPQIAELVANSFGEYPMYTLTFRDKFCNRESFIKYITKLNKVHISANAKKHKCLVGVKDDKIVSVALLQNPNISRITLFDYIRAGGIGLLFPVGFKRLINFFEISNQAHLDCEKSCKKDWYVELLAVLSNSKGQGIGSQMINDCLIPYVKKQGGKKIALTTNTEQNCKFYIKNGFINFAFSKLKWKDKSIQDWSFYKELK